MSLEDSGERNLKKPRIVVSGGEGEEDSYSFEQLIDIMKRLKELSGKCKNVLIVESNEDGLCNHTMITFSNEKERDLFLKITNLVLTHEKSSTIYQQCLMGLLQKEIKETILGFLKKELDEDYVQKFSEGENRFYIMPNFIKFLDETMSHDELAAFLQHSTPSIQKISQEKITEFDGKIYATRQLYGWC